ncbi:MAG: DUF1016 N-terminal domain-containing protein [Legionella sp.]|uniref:DUF1016 N-terminal domain-containing protein n=1 Tax=Legionella sp. TaxID=459 RepID=UPI0028412B32|nr:DUF1016 N-terminal domain-containing protein [Legionella sp.]
MMGKIQLGLTHEQNFDDIVNLIKSSKNLAYQAVNTVLIDLYWRIGEYISKKISHAEWGEGVVEQLASYISRTQSGIRGFTRPNLFRMKQFYEIYHRDEIVSPLVRQFQIYYNRMIFKVI